MRTNQVGQPVVREYGCVECQRTHREGIDAEANQGVDCGSVTFHSTLKACMEHARRFDLVQTAVPPSTLRAEDK